MYIKWDHLGFVTTKISPGIYRFISKVTKCLSLNNVSNFIATTAVMSLTLKMLIHDVCKQKNWYFKTYQSNLNYALKSGTYLSYGLCIVMVVMLNEICLHDSPTFRKTILYDSALSGMMAKFGSIVKIWKVCKITYLLGFSI